MSKSRESRVMTYSVFHFSSAKALADTLIGGGAGFMARHGWAWPAALAAMLSLAAPVAANTVNLGFNWSATAPDGYNVDLDEAMGTLRTFPGTSTAAIPLKLIVPNWSTTDPVMIKFTGPSQGTQDRFMLRMRVADDTGRDWNGFTFAIQDTQIDFPNGTTQQRGSLLHPDRAHLHTDKILPDRLGFEVLDIIQQFYTGPANNQTLQTRRPYLEGSSGVYSLDLFSGLSDFVVMDQEVWSPFVFDPNNPKNPTKSSLLDIHLHFTGRENLANSTFTLVLQPQLVPEPSTPLLVATGLVGLLGCGWRPRKRQSKPKNLRCAAQWRR